MIIETLIVKKNLYDEFDIDTLEEQDIHENLLENKELKKRIKLNKRTHWAYNIETGERRKWRLN